MQLIYTITPPSHPNLRNGTHQKDTKTKQKIQELSDSFIFLKDHLLHQQILLTYFQIHS
jgi:hypothetical protein